MAQHSVSRKSAVCRTNADVARLVEHFTRDDVSRANAPFLGGPAFAVETAQMQVISVLSTLPMSSQEQPQLDTTHDLVAAPAQPRFKRRTPVRETTRLR